jgi:heme-degrading monooxygenase HmoA
VGGETRYFVYTRWETEEDYRAWSTSTGRQAHSGERARPVASGASLPEFEVVQHIS